jgi:hypothetical protein
VTDAERTKWAIRIVANRVVSLALSGVSPEWQNYPDIGEDDWKAVMAMADRIAVHDARDYYTAYRLLTQRAEGVEA